MQIKAIPLFFKKRNKLIEKELLTLEEYEDTRDIFKANPKDKRLRPHKIKCKENQTIISLTVENSQIRILVNMKNCDESIAVFSWIGKHREYEKIIKDKKNCKSIFVDCEEIQEAEEI